MMKKGKITKGLSGYGIVMGMFVAGLMCMVFTGCGNSDEDVASKDAVTVKLGLGDLGKPADYEQRIKDFKTLMSDYDTYVKQLPESFDWRDQNVANSLTVEVHKKDTWFSSVRWAFASLGGFKNAVAQEKDTSWRGIVTSAKNQGACGSSWAFGAVGALESKILMKGGPAYDLSEQQQISCNTTSSGCCGGSLYAPELWYERGPLEEICTAYPDFNTSYGSCGCKGVYPFVSCSGISCGNLNKCNELPYRTKDLYYVDTNNINDVKISLKKDGPAPFRFDVYSDFSDDYDAGFWRDGSIGSVYVHNKGYKRGGHLILLIGWDDNKKAWLCKNSWGATGGPNHDGTFWIAYSGHSNDLVFGMSNFQIISAHSTTTVPLTIVAPKLQNGNVAAANLSEEEIAELAKAGDYRAPLAAYVSSISVKVGQEVAAGDQLLVLEVMKQTTPIPMTMQTPIVAEAAGVVGTVSVKVGLSVQPGDKLVMVILRQ